MTNDATEQPRDFPAGGAAFDMARLQLTEQFRAIEASDSKAERVLTAGLAVVGVYAAIIALSPEEAAPGATTVAVGGGVLLVLAFAAVATFFYAGYSISDWDIGPTGEQMLRVGAEHPDSRMRFWLAEQIVASYSQNERTFGSKARRFTWALRLLLVEFGVFIFTGSAIAGTELAAGGG